MGGVEKVTKLHSASGGGGLRVLIDVYELSAGRCKSMLTAALVAVALVFLLFLGARFSASPLTGFATELYLLHARHPASPNLRELVDAAAKNAGTVVVPGEFIFLAVSFLTSLISSVAAFYMNEAATAPAEPPGIKTGQDRGGRLRGPLVTLVCIVGLAAGHALFLEALVLLLPALADRSTGFLVLGVLAASAARLLSFTVGVICGQGLAISMLEDESCSGMNALVLPILLLRNWPPPEPEELPV